MVTVKRPTRQANNKARNLIQGGSAGVITGAAIGLTESVVMLGQHGAHDLKSPVIAVMIYGLIGLPIGILMGMIATSRERKRLLSDGEAWAMGASGCVLLLGGAVAFTQTTGLQQLPPGFDLNLYGPPIGGTIGLAVAIFAIASKLLDGPLQILLNGLGLLVAWGLLIIVTGLLSLVPISEDPKEGWVQGASVPTSLTSRPNILVIVVDSLPAGHISAQKTPALSALASQSIFFERAWAASSASAPAMSTILTSMVPSTHSVMSDGQHLPSTVTTFAERLSGSGYTTAAFVNDVYTSDMYNFDQGFELSYYRAPERWLGVHESVSHLSLYALAKWAASRAGRAFRSEEYYSPARQVLADARAWVELNKEGRWALTIHIAEPRGPFGTDTAGASQAYDDAIGSTDVEIGVMIEWLQTQGLFDNLVVVLTSNHGASTLERSARAQLSDEQLHIPLMIKMARGALTGRHVTWSVSAVDIAPTLAALAGVEPAQSWQGVDLVADTYGQLESRSARAVARVQAGEIADEIARLEAKREAAIEEGADPEELAIKIPTMPVVPSAPIQTRGEPRDHIIIAQTLVDGLTVTVIRAQGFKMVVGDGLPLPLLFDLLEDPQEQHDLVGSDAKVGGRTVDEIVTDLRSLLRVRLQSAN